MLETMIAERVETALACKFRCELGNPKTGMPMTPDDRRRFLTRAFAELVKGMGADRFAETPVERLDQFAVMSVIKDHDTAGLLLSLVNSFMIAYSTPETADRAFSALLQIEALRAEVAEARGQHTPNTALRDAAEALDVQLREHLPSHSVTSPMYRILVGPDRLFVMSPQPLSGLPDEINGVPIEAMPGDLAAKAH